MSLRRRSIASLSSLFQRGSSVSDLDIQKKSQPAAPQQLSASSSTTSTNNNASRRHSSGDLRQLIKQEKKKPQLRVDTDSNDTAGSQARRGGLKGNELRRLLDGMISLLIFVYSAFIFINK